MLCDMQASWSLTGQDEMGKSDTEIQPSTIKRVPGILVDKPIDILDDAFHSPAKRTLRFSKNTPLKRGIRKTTSSFSTNYNISHAYGDTSSKSPKFTEYSIANCSQDFGISSTANYSTTLTVGQEPWEDALNGLFVEFLQSMRTHGSERQIFDTVSDFIENCTNTLENLRDMQYKIPEAAKLLTKVRWLVNERETWCLIYAVYKDRLSRGEKEQNEAALQSISMHQLSEKEVVQELYKNNHSIRECQLVVDWLEQNALQESQRVNVQHYTDKTVAWENTLHQLKNEPLNIPYASTRPILNKLDPDAPLRERKPLHDLDMEDEVKLVRDIFCEIRCGRLEEAQNLCLHCGQPWRAAALEGWRLFHDPNFIETAPISGEKLPVEGNPNRDLWKLMAWRLASDTRMPGYARATHAIFCGNLEALEPVCESWSDLLWAYMKVMIDLRVEKEIRASVLRSYVPMPDEYWQNKIMLEEIFMKLGASKRNEIAEAASNPDHIVQKYIILDQIPSLMDAMLEWIKNADSQFLRFMAHLVLFFRYIGQGDQDGTADSIIEAYVKVLMEMEDPQLVACYVAALPQDDQICLYAQFLEKVTEDNERMASLTAAEDAGLDIETVTKRVVENIRNREVTGQLSALQIEATPEDLIKVSALSWLIFYPSQRSEALFQANAMIRQFLALGKMESARKAFNKIPIDSIDIIIREYCGNRDGMPELLDADSLPPRIACSVREYLCHRTYLDAEEGFSDWFHHFHNAKPIAPPLPVGEVSFPERVAFDHKKNQYNIEMERWKMAMQQQTKMVKTQLYNVLTFPEGGWLVDVDTKKDLDQEGEVDEEYKCRQYQLENLRKLCIPKVVLLLVSLVQSMGEHTECVQLADLIVSEQHQLYKVYTAQKLQDLMRKLGESSLQLMKNKRDAWGHPITF